MNTYTQILYQIVFGTQYRRTVLNKENRSQLFKYMYGILRNRRCHVYRINGVEDHLHIATHIHPAISLSSVVKELKVASTWMIKDQSLFPYFSGWQTGYSAFTYSIESKDRLIEYIKRQEEHHRKKTYREELIDLLKEHNIEFDERYLD